MRQKWQRKTEVARGVSAGSLSRFRAAKSAASIGKAENPEKYNVLDDMPLCAKAR